MSAPRPLQLAERPEAGIDVPDGVIERPHPLPADDFDAQLAQMSQRLGDFLDRTLGSGTA